MKIRGFERECSCYRNPVARRQLNCLNVNDCTFVVMQYSLRDNREIIKSLSVQDGDETHQQD